MSDPIFIVGVPRSGTTWLWSLFEALPNVKVLTKDNTTSESAIFVKNRLSVAKKIVEKELSNLRKGQVLVEKTPLHFKHMTKIKNAFPESKIVWIQRDLRDVIASMVHTKRVSVQMEFDKAVRFTETFLSGACLEHVDYTVRYEDLSKDTFGTFTNLLESLNVEFTVESVKRSVNLNENRSRVVDWNYRKGMVGSYRDDLTEEQIRIIEKRFPSYADWMF